MTVMPSDRLLQILSQYGAEDGLKDALLAFAGKRSSEKWHTLFGI